MIIEEKDYSIPEEFLEYTKFIGEDVSVLNVDTSEWDYDKVSQELWKGSLFGNSGEVSVCLGWDNSKIVGFIFIPDDHEAFLSDIESIKAKTIEIFGNDLKNETETHFEVSGKGDFSFSMQKSGAKVEWNDELAYKYWTDPARPKPQQKNESKTTYTKPKSVPAIGMTAEEVRESTWGNPTTINKTTTKYGVSEQWVYRSSSKTRYIYFENGIVTVIQE